MLKVFIIYNGTNKIDENLKTENYLRYVNNFKMEKAFV